MVCKQLLTSCAAGYFTVRSTLLSFACNEQEQQQQPKQEQQQQPQQQRTCTFFSRSASMIR
jgi:hypothetical protein